MSRPLAAACAGAALTGLVAFATRPTLVPSQPDPLTAATVTSSAGGMSLGHAEVAFHPGGRAVAFEVIDHGAWQIWTAPLDSPEARPVPGTEGGRGPAFSHDGKWIAFTANGRLMKVSAGGGSPVILANAPHLHGAAWSLDDRFIVYAPTIVSGLWRVSAEGGTPEQLTRVDPAIGEVTHEWPVVAPDGRVYFVINAQVRTLDDSHIASIDPASGRWRVVIRNALAPRFDGTGHMFYVDRTGALAVTSAPSTDAAPAAPTALAARPFLVSGNGVYDIAKTGVVAYAQQVDYARRQVVVASGDGRERVVSDRRPYFGLAAAPDGTRMAASVAGGSVLIADLARPAWTVSRAVGVRPQLLWTPDSARVLFIPGPGQLGLIDAAGTVSTESLGAEAGLYTPLDWLPGTSSLLVRELSRGGMLGEHTLGSAGVRPVPTFEQSFAMTYVAVEPRRRLMAYASDYSGRYEVYVRALDRPEPTIRVTTDAAGLEPHWSSDGRRLFFSNATGGLEMVDVTGPPLGVSAVQSVPYVKNKALPAGSRQTFAILPDDSILFVQEGDTSARDRLFVHQDWRSLLPADAPARTQQ